MTSTGKKNGIFSWLLPVAIVAAVSAAPSSAEAASDYEGRIGKIDLRTGHADTTVYRNGLTIRDANKSVVCAVAPGVENFDQFVSMATAAMLAGKSVRIKRGGEMNGAFKCYLLELVN